MNGHRVASLVRVESLYLRRLLIPPIVYLALPLALMVFLEDAMHRFFQTFGYPSATGAEFLVPAQAVLFGYMLTEHAGLWVFSEHAWRTWDRVRATAATTGEVLAAKALHWGGYLLAQYVVLFVAGALILGMHIAGTALALVPLLFANLAATMAFGFCGIAWCPSQATFDAWTYGGALVLSAVGGGITPQNLLPSWAASISPISPVYWTMRATKAVILDGGGFAEVATPCLVLCGFAAGLTLLGVLRFDPAAAKIGRSK